MKDNVIVTFSTEELRGLPVLEHTIRSACSERYC